MRSDIALVTFNRVPDVNLSYKYDRLGPMAIENHRAYCERHGYDFIDDADVSPDRPATWAKLPAVRKALEGYEWVLWADSDTLVFNDAFDVRDWRDSRFDLVAQCPRAYLEPLGWVTRHSLEAMQFNAGVFMIRNSAWSIEMLERAYEQDQFVKNTEVWNGVGDQEAIQHVLRSNPDDFDRIRYVEHLQCHPRCRNPDIVFVHFYGNHARHCLSDSACLDVLDRWEQCVMQREPLPDDLPRFHWSCIQNKSPVADVDRGGPERFFYSAAEIGL